MKFNVKRIFHSAKFKAQQHSPEILVVSGILTMIGATVAACHAMTKVKAIKEEYEKNLSIVDACEESGMVDENEEYTHEDAVRDRRALWIKKTFKYCKIFAPAFGLALAGAGEILYGHHILKKRYLSLGAAYSALDKAYEEYRKRVEDKYGAEAEKEIRYGYGTEDKPQEDGKETPLSPNEKLKCSPYARFFDESCNGWDKNPETSLFFLKLQMSHFNNRLHERGYVFLNEVYEVLGIELTAEGQSIGWIFDKDHQDTYIDFGIYDVDKPRNRAFVNGYENVILLDFNVTGNILGYFKKKAA